MDNKDSSNLQPPNPDRDNEQPEPRPLATPDTKAGSQIPSPHKEIADKTFTQHAVVVERQEVITNAEARFSQPPYHLTAEDFRIITSNTYEGELLPTLTRGAVGAFFGIVILLIVKYVLSRINNQPINIQLSEVVTFCVSLSLALLLLWLNKVLPNEKRAKIASIKQFFRDNPGAVVYQRRQE